MPDVRRHTWCLSVRRYPFWETGNARPNRQRKPAGFRTGGEAAPQRMRLTRLVMPDTSVAS